MAKYRTLWDGRRGAAAWALCVIVVALGAALFPLTAAATATGGDEEGTAPDPLLRVIYGELRERGVLQHPHRSPRQEAVLSYIEAHDGRRRDTVPPDTWSGLLRESLAVADSPTRELAAP